METFAIYGVQIRSYVDAFTGRRVRRPFLSDMRLVKARNADEALRNCFVGQTEVVCRVTCLYEAA